jgi:hypothetical protein
MPDRMKEIKGKYTQLDALIKETRNEAEQFRVDKECFGANMKNRVYEDLQTAANRSISLLQLDGNETESPAEKLTDQFNSAATVVNERGGSTQ